MAKNLSHHPVARTLLAGALLASSSSPSWATDNGYASYTPNSTVPGDPNFMGPIQQSSDSQGPTYVPGPVPSYLSDKNVVTASTTDDPNSPGPSLGLQVLISMGLATATVAGGVTVVTFVGDAVAGAGGGLAIEGTVPTYLQNIVGVANFSKNAGQFSVAFGPAVPATQSAASSMFVTQMAMLNWQRMIQSGNLPSDVTMDQAVAVFEKLVLQFTGYSQAADAANAAAAAASGP